MSIELVGDAATFREWLDVMVAGFGMPAQMAFVGVARLSWLQAVALSAFPTKS